MKMGGASLLLSYAFLLMIGMTLATCHSSKKIKVTDLFDAEKLNNSGFGVLIYFSAHSCPPCMDVVRKMNELTDGIPILGVLDERDQVELSSIRNKYAFPIERMSEKFKPYKPLLSPSLVAIDRHGRILMTLPGLPGQDLYIEQILFELVPKAIGL